MLTEELSPSKAINHDGPEDGEKEAADYQAPIYDELSVAVGNTDGIQEELPDGQ